MLKMKNDHRLEVTQMLGRLAFVIESDPHDRGRQDYRSRRHDPYYYAQPVYAPPPASYPARPSPGITLFFPLDIR
jgi:hypothetical protein